MKISSARNQCVRRAAKTASEQLTPASRIATVPARAFSARPPKKRHLNHFHNHAKSVEVETTVHNTIEDHRFRVLCPSGAKNAKTWFAHHPFDFTERAIAINPETRDWSEMELPEKPYIQTAKA